MKINSHVLILIRLNFILLCCFPPTRDVLNFGNTEPFVLFRKCWRGPINTVHRHSRSIFLSGYATAWWTAVTSCHSVLIANFLHCRDKICQIRRECTSMEILTTSVRIDFFKALNLKFTGSCSHINLTCLALH